MEDPGETGAHPLGATSLNFVPGHQQKEKLVNLGDQPGAVGEGSYRRIWRGQDGWEAQNGKRCSPQTLAQVWCLPPGHLQTHCMTHLMPEGYRQVGPNNQHVL